MAAIGDVVQVTLSGSYLNSDWVNVFYYRVQDTPTPGYLTGLAAEFNTTVVGSYRSFASDATMFTRLRLTNLFGDDELEYNLPAGTFGVRPSVSGGAQPNVIAAGIRLTRGNKRVRHGYKYVIGGLEVDVNNNYWNVASLNLLSALADAMTTTLNPGLGTDSLAPVIVGRVKTEDGYRLPTSQAEMADNWAYIVGYAVSPTVTTMRSRKPEV